MPALPFGLAPVVLITEHYVETPTTLSAASAAKALFGEMEKKGWHEVRLIGLTDALMNQDNAPADHFQRAAAAKLRAGEASHEEVVTEKDVRYLRYATPIPVVMARCPAVPSELGRRERQRRRPRLQSAPD